VVRHPRASSFAVRALAGFAAVPCSMRISLTIPDTHGGLVTVKTPCAIAVLQSR
jgi:hypothetical protein